MYERYIVPMLANRLLEPRRFIQIVEGPRQTGKSTAVAQALRKLDTPVQEFVFDRPRDQLPRTLEDLWKQARSMARQTPGAILSLDEVQKVPDWSATVKYLWDEDSRNGLDLRVVITGSSTLLLRKGMADSLKGRYEVIPSTQWTFDECREAFGFTYEDFLFFGGYPGAASLKDDEDRWLAYVREAIVEPTLTQDVLEMEVVRKPALLRALFEVGAVYSAQEISYRKLLGQLDDRGNTDTIAHYLELLSRAGLLSGLPKYDEKVLKERASSPRLLAHDTALMVTASGERRERLRENSEYRGHLVETAVGAYLLARASREGFTVTWWRKGSHEVDFVVTKGRRRTANEVKSWRVKSLKGLGEFVPRYPGTYALVIGSNEFPVDDFLLGRVPLFQ